MRLIRFGTQQEQHVRQIFPQTIVEGDCCCKKKSTSVSGDEMGGVGDGIGTGLGIVLGVIGGAWVFSKITKD